LDVLTELKTENRTHGITARMLLGDFIDVYKKKNLYVTRSPGNYSSLFVLRLFVKSNCKFYYLLQW